MARDVASVIAVGVNCTDPRDAATLAALAHEASGKPVVVYPNSGESWDGAARVWVGDAAFDPSAVDRWVASGARLVGGCCRVGPTEIAILARQLSGTSAG